jgi:glycosyltransferase involved in cell wall biosynthesis
VEVTDGPLELLGEWRDMVALYNALDVFVLPSYREGFSRSAMEAAACGVPMVLSDIRGCREIGTDGEHLLLVPPGDADALHDAVLRLLDDPALRARLGSAAQARAAAEFDQRAVARASLETYVEVAGRRGLGWEVPSAPATR